MSKIKRLIKSGAFVDYSKYAYKARYGAAEKKIRKYLREHLDTVPNSLHECISKFRELKNIEPFILPREEMGDWMVDYYKSGCDKDVKRLTRNVGDKWNKLRTKVFRHYGRFCMCCGSTKKLHIDHIKPFSLYPELEFEFDNLQVLCNSCNSSKSNRKIIDYRPDKIL